MSMSKLEPHYDMTSPSDRLRTLPPELRQCVYSYLFNCDEDCTVRIRQMHNTPFESSSGRSLSAILAVCENPMYLAHRRRIPSSRWPDEIDKAFFQGV